MSTTMKRIGDVVRTMPIPPPKNGAIRITRRETVKCSICQDAGYLRADVPIGHPSFGRLFVCECKRREQDERHAEELRKLSNLEAFTGHTFDDFDASIDGVEEAYQAALAFAEEPAHRWLFLWGPCGVGKTHLAVAIAKHARQWHQMQVYFDVVPDLLDHLRATFDPRSGTAYDERFALIRSAQLLVLDDLGTENATPWAKEKLYQIINYRYSEQMPTVITSNVDQRKVDDRIMSRILDHRLTQYVEVDAEDYRRPGDPRRVRRARRM
jgi:DNA replication protein DnaC